MDGVFYWPLWRLSAKELRIVSWSLYRLSVAKEVGSDPTTAGGGVKGGERVAAAGVQRSRTDGKAHTGHRNSCVVICGMSLVGQFFSLKKQVHLCAKRHLLKQ